MYIESQQAKGSCILSEGLALQWSAASNSGPGNSIIKSDPILSGMIISVKLMKHDDVHK